MTDLSDEDREALDTVKWFTRWIGGGCLVILALVILNEMFGWMWQQP